MGVTLAEQHTSAVWATIKRDATVLKSYRMRVVGQILTILFGMTMFYYVAKLVRPGVVGPNGQYFAYVVVGIVSLSALTAALNLSQIVRAELLTGTFERILVSPLGPLGGVLALAAFPVIYSLGLSALMLAVAKEIYGFPVHLAGIPSALVVSALGTAAFVCIGLLFVATLLAFKSATGAGWVIAGLSILGGVYFPIKLFPGWLQWAADVQPFTPTVDLLRHLLLGTPSTQAVWLELVKLVGFTVTLMPLSVAILSSAVHLSRRRGTLMEY